MIFCLSVCNELPTKVIIKSVIIVRSRLLLDFVNMSIDISITQNRYSSIHNKYYECNSKGGFRLTWLTPKRQ